MAKIKPLEVFDWSSRKRVCYLQNAYFISVSQSANKVYTASFRLPINDEKRIHCTPMNLVKIWGDGVEIGLFRILPTKTDSNTPNIYIEYQLEHVISVLLDDMLHGFHQIGNTGVQTIAVMNYILAHQTDIRWVAQQCAYANEYLYGFQGESLLNALFSITSPFIEDDYIWSYDTSTFPWRISLKKASPTPITDIRYKKNLSSFSKTENPTDIVTVIYPYGYGDGDNKLNIKSVNNGLDYITSPNVDKYGHIEMEWVDQRITDPQALKNMAESLLSTLDSPKLSYSFVYTPGIDGIELNIGDSVRLVVDDTIEIMYVTEKKITDITGSYTTALTFGSRLIDLGDSYADIIQRQRISETYSQGAESIYSDSFADNADENFPLRIPFTIPDEAVHVNEILFTAELTNFRAYSKGTDINTEEVPIETEYEEQRHYHEIDVGWAGYTWMGSEYRPLYIDKDDGRLKGLSNDPVANTKTNENAVWDRHTHKARIPSYTHHYEILYGIYEGPKASQFDIYLDGVYLSTHNSQVYEFNLIPHLSQDANGKVLRGRHIIEIRPDSKTRVEVSFLIRLFTNSLGGNQH